MRASALGRKVGSRRLEIKVLEGEGDSGEG
jgi:hypothetical protein